MILFTVSFSRFTPSRGVVCAKHRTVATEIKVKLIPREYFVAFAFALILIGQRILRIQVHIETSPRI